MAQENATCHMFINSALECIIRNKGKDPVIEKRKEKDGVKAAVNFLLLMHKDCRAWQKFKSLKKTLSTSGKSSCPTLPPMPSVMSILSPMQTVGILERKLSCLVDKRLRHILIT
ncbi:hypothetical protein K443DRAFT_124306 [Laccaria amethystina LaAM-08-1]|uniref:Uncharacterized protein n=1 Tax=Laccaria amethystina LaAM-08-1 TaxID=1095629 RepID=A0A0C9XGI8_9AGAR|nr:hypothetical protein K443DRAFT_124306 [Laccaria amethystina LaAM-08-1]